MKINLSPLYSSLSISCSKKILIINQNKKINSDSYTITGLVTKIITYQKRALRVKEPLPHNHIHHVAKAN